MILNRLFSNKINKTCLISPVILPPTWIPQFQYFHTFGVGNNRGRLGRVADDSLFKCCWLSGKPIKPSVNCQIQSFGSSGQDVWQLKGRYAWFLPVQTRWKDNDQYLHVNNSVYHAMFDSVINVYLIRNLGLDILSATTPRGYMVTNSCTFYGSAAYPSVYMAGLAVSKLGRTSVQYKLGLFPLVDPSQSLFVDPVQGHHNTDPVLDMVEEKALVLGEYVHVFVDPETEKSTPVSQEWRAGLSKLFMS